MDLDPPAGEELPYCEEDDYPKQWDGIKQRWYCPICEDYW